ncbi:hypothetical protein B8A44_07500 [Dolosigranulum pigrum]|uniref:Uncharacterized protein n=1 Tax=Dolosigranulum pigrum TaxID=29394 RepID=A0A328KKP0_9LACT|nr:hypothetical protein [Dolosigranulum pigrum]RAN62384.1 hypothetical protein B8A44_07500 [Dolosigranulum pigrum]
MLSTKTLKTDLNKKDEKRLFELINLLHEANELDYDMYVYHMNELHDVIEFEYTINLEREVRDGNFDPYKKIFYIDGCGAFESCTPKELLIVLERLESEIKEWIEAVIESES